MHHQSPARPQDLTIESRLGKDIPARCVDGPSRRARHLTDLEILDPNQVESARNIGARLLGPVLPPVRLASAHPGDGQPQSVTTVRPPASAGEPTFQVVKPLTLLRGQARGMQQLTSRQGRRHHNAPVNAYGQVVTRRKNRLGNYGEGDMPAPGPVTRHSVRLHASRYDTGPTETHPSGLRYPNLSNLPAEPTHMPRLQGDDPESIVPASFAPCRPAMGTGEEIRHGLGEVPQRLLLHHLRACGQPGMLFPCGGELTALLKVTWRTRPAPAPMRMLLHSQVPHEPGMCAVVPQRAFLSARGDQPVSRHTNTLANASDISGRRERCSQLGLKAEPVARDSDD